MLTGIKKLFARRISTSCAIFLSMILIARVGHAQVVVGDDRLIGVYGLNLNCQDIIGYNITGIPPFPDSLHPIYGGVAQNPLRVQVYFHPTEAKVYSTQWVFNYGCQGQNGGSITMSVSAYGIPDTAVRVRPDSVRAALYYDLKNRNWQGSTDLFISNQTSNSIPIKSVRLHLPDSTMIVDYSVIDPRVGLNMIIPPHISGKLIRLHFITSSGDRKKTLFDTGTIGVILRQNGLDSEYLQPTTLTVDSTFQALTFSPTYHTLFPSLNSSAKDTTYIEGLDGVTRLSITPAIWPFTTRIIDSSSDMITLETTVAPLTPGSYSDEIFCAVTRALDAQHTEEDTLKIQPYAFVKPNGESPDWVPAAIPSFYRQGNLIHDSLWNYYYYGDGVISFRDDQAGYSILLDTTTFIGSFVISKSGSAYALTKFGDILRKSKGSQNWDTVKYDYPMPIPLRTKDSNSLRVVPTAAERLFVADDSEYYVRSYRNNYLYGEPEIVGLWYTSDSGSSWKLIDAMHAYDTISSRNWDPNRWIDMRFDSLGRLQYPDYDFAIQVGLDSLGFFRSIPGIFIKRSEWQLLSLRATQIYGMTQTPNGNLLAATEEGVYRSTDAGARWYGYGIGLPDNNVGDLQVNPSGHAYLTDYDGRVYKTRERLTDEVQAQPKQESGIGLWPNPANRSLHFGEFQTPATFEIWDVLGRLMMRGAYLRANSTLDVSALPTGAYSISITDGVTTKKAHLSVIHN